MAFAGYYDPHYPQNYEYNDHDISPPLAQEEFFPDQPRSQPGRHAVHGSFGRFDGNDYYSDPQYVTRAAPRYPENYHATPVSARPLGDHRSSYSPSSSPNSRHSEPCKNASPSPPSDDQRAYCNHRDCLDVHGNPIKSFSRKADVARHVRSAHERRYIDCPRRNCVRKGDQGFTRNDHLMEHRRQFHMEALPKKGGMRDGGGAKARHSA